VKIAIFAFWAKRANFKTKARSRFLGDSSFEFKLSRHLSKSLFLYSPFFFITEKWGTDKGDKKCFRDE